MPKGCQGSIASICSRSQAPGLRGRRSRHGNAAPRRPSGLESMACEDASQASVRAQALKMPRPAQAITVAGSRPLRADYTWCTGAPIRRTHEASHTNTTPAAISTIFSRMPVRPAPTAMTSESKRKNKMTCSARRSSLIIKPSLPALSLRVERAASPLRLKQKRGLGRRDDGQASSERADDATLASGSGCEKAAPVSVKTAGRPARASWAGY
jgi:hypothetical protein